MCYRMLGLSVVVIATGTSLGALHTVLLRMTCILQLWRPFRFSFGGGEWFDALDFWLCSFVDDSFGALAMH